MSVGYSTRQLNNATQQDDEPIRELDGRSKFSAAQMRLQLGQHMFVAGMTRSGKTYFVRQVLTRVIPPRVPIVVFDPKRAWELPSDKWEVVERLPRNWERLTSRERRPELLRLVLRPRFMDDQRFNPDLNEAYTRLFDRGRVVLSLEDAHELVKETRASMELARLYRLGAQDARATVYGNTQRPSALPRWMISEAAHAVSFWLVDERDRDIAAKFMGKDVLTPPGPGKHDFWYRGPEPGQRPILVHQ